MTVADSKDKRTWETECECNLREKLVGDGCRWCNPEYAKQFERDEE